MFGKEFDFDKLKNDVLNEDVKFFTETCSNVIYDSIYYILTFFVRIGMFLSNICFKIKNSILRDKYNNIITRIDYLNHIDYYKHNIFHLSLFKKFLLLFSNTKQYYNIEEETIYKIKDLITSSSEGFIKINYYDKEKKNKVLINLSLFKNSNLLFKNIELIISNVIQNFIKNIVVYEDKNILYSELVYKNKSDDITDIYKQIKNSLKNNNITLYDLLLLLNINIYDLENIDFNEFSLIVTDGDLEQTTYKYKDYINYKTLYEDFAVRKLD
tara:strand:+ start:784 stop:1593 length:810 start_codon:yes stop_codon:yes gene_type:complete